jgi:hypothetical protein
MYIVVIMQFVACPDGVLFNWEYSREFNIGEKVMFLDDYEDVNVRQDHLKWMIRFQCEDGSIYSASQLYFVTLEEWGEIVQYFINRPLNVHD